MFQSPTSLENSSTGPATAAPGTTAAPTVTTVPTPTQAPEPAILVVTHTVRRTG